MQIILVALLATVVIADVSHLVNQPSPTYQYPSASPENNPLSSYGVPQSSVLGNASPSISYSSAGSASQSQLTLPSASGPSVDFVSRFTSSLPSGIPVESYNTFSNPLPPSAEVSSFQVSTPAPSVQVSTSSPSVDFSGFQVSTPSPSPPSVNFVQYSQPPNSYQFLSSLSQPTVSIPSFGVSTPGLVSQFGSDANLNSGVSVNSNSNVGVQSSGGSLSEAFGVATDATAVAGNGETSADSDVTKKLYFFAAPEDEEEEEIQARYDLPEAPPKQTYKIIFIKAPTYRSKATITVPAPVQNQERTLVYVLVKKPELHPTVRFQPSATATEAPKPEVFFIRYKTQKEAEAAVADIQSKHGASGEIIANLAAGNQNPEGATINIGGPVETNVVSSTPAPTNFNSRISETVEVNQAPGNQPETNQSAFEVSIGRGGIAPSVTPVTFGQNSVDAQSVFGSGIAADRNVQEIDSRTAANLSGILIGDNTASSQDEGTTSAVGSTEATTVEEDSQNFVQQRVGGDDAQSSQVVGFSAYGPPNY